MDNQTQERAVSRAWMSLPTMEGAGVHLRRGFGHRELPQIDPFLLLEPSLGEPDDYRPVSVAPASRHRDDHLHPRRRRRARR
jgi:redox-sensitive bicupin YhaK (pirin superfamily)